MRKGQPLLSIAAAVVTRITDGRLLLVRRRKPEPGLLWQHPAGGIEPGETAEQAAVREAHEEAGITVVPGVRIGERTHNWTGRHIVYVACLVVSGTAHVAAPREVAETAWIPPYLLDTYVPAAYAPVRQYLGLTPSRDTRLKSPQ
ncbi:NUDIX hydrolase [Streptomyces sp. NPDC020875]|uniref:NUDIX hydrolase n=1 Tax=Streptomyces sp. NPDC020875 TaxID=3154898 RepID=UPI0033C5DE7D